MSRAALPRPPIARRISPAAHGRLWAAEARASLSRLGVLVRCWVKVIFMKLEMGEGKLCFLCARNCVISGNGDKMFDTVLNSFVTVAIADIWVLSKLSMCFMKI